MKRENRSFALVVVALFALTAGLVGMPQPARGIALTVEMNVTWGMFTEPYNIQAEAELLMYDGTPFDPPKRAGLVTFDNEHYEIGFWNPPSTADLVCYTWEEGEDYDWEPLSGEIIDLNWSGVTTLEASAGANRACGPEFEYYDFFSPIGNDCEYAYSNGMRHAKTNTPSVIIESPDLFIAPVVYRLPRVLCSALG